MEDHNEFFSFEELKLEESTLSKIMGENPIEEDLDKDKEKLEDKEKNKEITEKTQEELDKEKLENNKDKQTPSSEAHEDSSTFSVFANLLKEEGVLSLENDDLKSIKTSKDLVEAVKKQIENSKFENLSESQKRYLEAVESGIPQADFEKLERQLSQLEKIDEKFLTEENDNSLQARFDIIAHDWIAKGLSKEKAVDLANRSIKLGTDKEDAKEALESLIKVKTEEYKDKVLKAKENNKVSLEKLKEEIDSREVILKDVKITPKFKTDLYNLLSLKVDSDEEGQPINELNKWRKDNKLEAEIILGALYLQTNKFQNLGKILDTAKSKSALELEKKLKQADMNDLSKELSSGSFNNKYEINV